MIINVLSLAFILGLPLLVGAVDEPVIAPGALLQIALKGIPAEDSRRLDGCYRVSSNSILRLPDLKEPLRIAGLKPSEISHSIEIAYVASGRFKTPKAETTLIAEWDRSAGPAIVMGGLVRHPGPQNFSAGMTVEQAVKGAGGIAEHGNPEIAYLYRDGKSSVLDLTDDQDKNRQLKPNDVLEVSFKSSHSAVVR